MIYTVRHLTTYRYARAVRFAQCNLRLRPAEGDGQSVLDGAITVCPSPRRRLRRRDFFGTDTDTLLIDTPHTEFTVEATHRVRVERPAPPAPDSSPSWEELRALALASPRLGGEGPAHFLFPTRRTPTLEPVTDYARASFPAGRGAYEGACDLMRRIATDFRFDAEATTVTTPLAEAFAERAGVCQDFAHIMIAGLRGLGLPAAYVSGYLRTKAPPGRPRLRGADASHAWVAFWTGGSCVAGSWVGLDPTNGIPVRDDHVGVARGRDYGDVAPIDGLVSSSGTQRLKVEVDVVPEGDGLP